MSASAETSETKGRALVPKLVSRRTGGLITWVVDRQGMSAPAPAAPAAPATPGAQSVRSAQSASLLGSLGSVCSPEANETKPKETKIGRGSSPETPPFKPSLPPRGKDCPSPLSPKPVKQSVECPSPISVASPKTFCSRTSRDTSPSSACSDTDCEETTRFPVWPVYVPMVPPAAMAMYHLQACFQNAKQLAQIRQAPTDEPCVVGCCCTRCIGIPAAFRPKGKEVVETKKGSTSSPKKEKEDFRDDASTTSMSSSESSDLDISSLHIQPKVEKRTSWCTKDVRLQQGLPFNTQNRTIVCSKMHADTSAVDVQQAFEQRFRAMPDYRRSYLKGGRGWIQIVTGACWQKYGSD